MTTTKQTVEQRLKHLEAELARIDVVLRNSTLQSTSPENSSSWLDQLAGSISNEALFDESLEYGKQHRQNS
ncbi:transferase hexapeptide repeat containing protein [filamentous cyanobacterium LEGE 11480]|uniref:Transferase hexapeptide repeat containing protein n=1 Tax=Romeriopsis navalis LEGE 11480 TaxID=2777977 RepID=A0A928VRF8_9CYAN|nr:hypothetical protein [Romeriopsis navalis]MBE9032382.1 transferase hexapeptide repeat containing protein [Romeriopsis navalis LEGE 11480]